MLLCADLYSKNLNIVISKKRNSIEKENNDNKSIRRWFILDIYDTWVYNLRVSAE